MVTFLNPWAPAAALALAAVLCIIALLRRLRVPHVEFAPLVWVLEARARTPARRRLRTRLNFILTLASILLLGAVFGRPVAGGAPGAAAQVMVILDGSLSMRAGGASPIFAEARQRAAELILALPPGDQANLALAGDQVLWAYPRAGAGLDRGPLWRLLERAQPGYGRGTLADAVKEALAFLARAGAGEKRICVISDFQPESWRAVPLPPLDGVAVEAIAIRPPRAENYFIAPARRAAFFAFAGEPVTVAVDAGGAVDRPRRTQLTWQLDGRTVAIEPVELPAGERARFTRTFTFAEEGIVEGRASLDPGDTLAEDDTARFTIAIARRARVSLAGASPEVRDRLAHALGAGKGGPFLRADGASDPAADLTIAAGPSREDDTGMLPRIEFRTAAVPGRPPERGTFRLAEDFDGNTLTRLPSAALVRADERAAAPFPGDVLLRFDDGWPAVVLDRAAGITACSFGLERTQCSLLWDRACAPAAVALVGELARRALAARLPDLTAGQEARIVLPAGPYRFFAPGEAEFFPEAVPLGPATRITLPVASVPGHVRIWREGRLVASLPVNPPPAESHLSSDEHVLALWTQARGAAPLGRGREATGTAFVLLCAAQGLLLHLAAGRRNHGRR